VRVKVNDPYYSKRELKEITGAEAFDFPEGLSEFDTLLIVSGHAKYVYTNYKRIKSNLENCKLIIDNTGVWKNIDFGPIEYHEVGDKNWLIPGGAGAPAAPGVSRAHVGRALGRGVGKKRPLKTSRRRHARASRAQA